MGYPCDKKIINFWHTVYKLISLNERKKTICTVCTYTVPKIWKYGKEFIKLNYMFHRYHEVFATSSKTEEKVHSTG
jgi:hypothetical protein